MLRKLLQRGLKASAGELQGDVDEETQEELQTWHRFGGLLGGLALVSEPMYEPQYQADASVRMLEILTPPAPEKGRPFWGGADGEFRRFGFVAIRP